jgi:SAM-dependent methyltransferase
VRLSAIPNAYRQFGAAGTLRYSVERILPQDSSTTELVLAALRDKNGLEVGGPSARFGDSNGYAVYDVAATLDNVNFAVATLWEHDLIDGGDFRPGSRRLGTQFLREANNLEGLADDHYDFVVSSHLLEHVANPLGALREWRRVCRPDGYLLLVLPHRDGTFDHRRTTTSMEHLKDDDAHSRPEDDETHLNEVLSLHDLRRDPGAGSLEEFTRRANDNVHTRVLHHHVFDLEVAISVTEEAGWGVIRAEARWPHDIFVVAQPRGAEPPASRTALGTSPFPSDRRFLRISSGRRGGPLSQTLTRLTGKRRRR